MWYIILAIVIISVVLVLLYYILSISARNKKRRKRAKKTAQQIHNTVPRRKNIEDCISKEDIQYQLSVQQRTIVKKVNDNKEEIKQALNLANNRVNTEWLNSYEKVAKVSENLEFNLRNYARNNLENSKFHYYSSLWFRSMLAADLVHREFKEIDASFNEINKLILSIKKGNNIGLNKKVIYESKDIIKEVRITTLNRVHELNQNTAVLRNKIGKECGERGRQWYEERMRNRN